MAIGNMHKNWVKIGHVVLGICLWTDRKTNTHIQTNRHASHNVLPPLPGLE